LVTTIIPNQIFSEDIVQPLLFETKTFWVFFLHFCCKLNR